MVAARLARHARRVCPSLHTVRSSPRVIFPCPMTPAVLQAFQRVVRRALRVLPSPCRLDNFEVVARCLSACWRGSPYLTDVLSPSIPSLEYAGPCSCMHTSTGVQHIRTREWQHLRCCYALTQLLGDIPLQMRVFPSPTFRLQSARSSVVCLRVVALKKTLPRESMTRYV